jgi:P27 family predicted phage terminase small subunit
VAATIDDIARKLKPPHPPKHLKSTDARRLWRRTVEAFELEAHHLALLEQACKALDRLVEARDVIDRDGITVLDRYGVPKQHPACAIERGPAGRAGSGRSGAQSRRSRRG